MDRSTVFYVLGLPVSALQKCAVDMLPEGDRNLVNNVD